MKLQLHISTCPNDTFMFDAMVHRRIDTEGLEFDLSLADIEQLNAGALQGVPDLSKLSYAVVPQLPSELGARRRCAQRMLEAVAGAETVDPAPVLLRELVALGWPLQRVGEV